MPFGKEEIRTEFDINPSICFSGLKTVNDFFRATVVSVSRFCQLKALE